MSKGTILYVGGFELPDKNAAAQRVINNAKALRELGFELYFINAVKFKTSTKWIKYFGFECFEYERENQILYLLNIKQIKRVIKLKHINTVIAYNYPAIALSRLLKFCKSNNLKCYADVTEWYVAQGNPFFKIIKNLDSNYRMKIIHPRMDGVITISDFLYRFYKDKVKTVKIPPLIDITDDKWIANEKNNNYCELVYAGSPTLQKECLNVLVDAIEALKQLGVRLKIVGITKDEYEKLYDCKYEGNAVTFLGRVPHFVAIEYIKSANWTVILRENNLVVKAGFPTKVVESITAGTPIISNRFSNICDYLNPSNSILVENHLELQSALKTAMVSKVISNNKIFDYHNYIDDFKKLL